MAQQQAIHHLYMFKQVDTRQKPSLKRKKSRLKQAGFKISL